MCSLIVGHKEINEISSKFLYLEEDNGKKYIVTSSDVEITIDITYLDETRSYYDKEEDRYLIETYIKARETHKTNIELRWECHKKDSADDENLEKRYIINNNVMSFIELSESTMIDKEILDLTKNEDDDMEYCNQCGKPLGNIDHIEHVDYEGRPLCRDCMKGDSEGEICPICSRKIPHQYMMSGICQECAEKSN